MSGAVSAIAGVLQRAPWLLAGIILVAGYGLAVLLRLVLSRLLEFVRFNQLFDRIGVAEVLRKGQVKNQPSRLVGMLAFWTVLVIAFFWIARVLDIRVLSSVSDSLERSAPSVVAAIFIGIIGVVVVSFLANFVSTLARTAGYPYHRLLARFVRIGVGLIIADLALDEMHLSGTLLSSLLLILVAAAAFGTALAFGLGCKDLAREAMLRFLSGLREKGRISKGSDLEG